MSLANGCSKWPSTTTISAAISPINAQVRALIDALRPELSMASASTLPIYWGNRNWHPMLADDDGHDGPRRRPPRSGPGPGGLQFVFKLSPVPRRHRPRPRNGRPRGPRSSTRSAFSSTTPASSPRMPTGSARRWLPCLPIASPRAHLAFTAHSIPVSMATNSRYVEQLTETCRLVSPTPSKIPPRTLATGLPEPERPTVGPVARARTLSNIFATCDTSGVTDAVIHPIGFLSDHMEVLYDLDDEARRASESIGSDG